MMWWCECHDDDDEDDDDHDDYKCGATSGLGEHVKTMSFLPPMTVNGEW